MLYSILLKISGIFNGGDLDFEKGHLECSPVKIAHTNSSKVSTCVTYFDRVVIRQQSSITVPLSTGPSSSIP